MVCPRAATTIWRCASAPTDAQPNGLGGAEEEARGVQQVVVEERVDARLRVARRGEGLGEARLFVAVAERARRDALSPPWRTARAGSARRPAPRGVAPSFAAVRTSGREPLRAARRARSAPRPGPRSGAAAARRALERRGRGLGARAPARARRRARRRRAEVHAEAQRWQPWVRSRSTRPATAHGRQATASARPSRAEATPDRAEVERLAADREEVEVAVVAHEVLDVAARRRAAAPGWTSAAPHRARAAAPLVRVRAVGRRLGRRREARVARVHAAYARSAWRARPETRRGRAARTPTERSPRSC